MSTGEKTTAEVADAGAGPAVLVVDEAVKPYKIHIPNKYLEQVKRKLELTRLPHEGSEPKSEDWWEPKPVIEPLIDFWLEKYNWRDQESTLNSTLPQFRTAISLPPLASPIRLHFIHARSPHDNAIPLLLIPPFPFTNLSFGHLIKPLTNPEDPATNQPFHLVIPSLPGLGFSDTLPNNLSPIPAAAELLNSLMSRLSYPHYLASGAAPGHTSPAEIDWKLINRLSTTYPSSCLGAHFISPSLSPPTITQSPWEWTKWTIANFFHAEILGYTDSDFEALDRIHRKPGVSSTSPSSPTPSSSKSPSTTLEPNTLAYALCDSPSGILAYILKGLRTLNPTHNSSFSQEQLITLTNLAWLPGPEYALRFWAHCAAHDEIPVVVNKPKPTTLPTIAITVFIPETRRVIKPPTSGDIDIESSPGAILLAPIEKQPQGIRLTGPENAVETAAVTAAWESQRVENERYVCPAWARGRYRVVHTQRVHGKGGGLLAFERPSVVVDGVRGLARGVLAMKGGLFERETGGAAVVTDPTPGGKDGGTGTGTGGGAGGGTGGGIITPLEAVVIIPSTVVPSAAVRTPLPPLVEDVTEKETEKEKGKGAMTVADKWKGKEKEISPAAGGDLLSPPALPRDHSFGDGESPDTLVEKHTTPSPLLGDNATAVNSLEVSPARSPLGAPVPLPDSGIGEGETGVK